MRKGVILADEQIPYQIDLGAVNSFLKDFQPDIIVRLGDMLDMTALQGWNNKKPGDIDWEEIRQEIKIANRIMDEQDAICKSAKDKRFTFGNHEERLKFFGEKFPDYWRKNESAVPYLMRDLRLKERGYKTYGQNQLYNIGKLNFFHGEDYSTHHAQKNLACLEANVVYGHVHSPQRYSKVVRITNSPKSAWSLGCLCSRNPTWKNGAPNAWINGFGVFFVQDNGAFNLYPIDIIRGAFVAPNGRLYR